MARMSIERALAPKAVDALFEKHAEHQYTKELLFSSLVDLMGLVVCNVHPKVSAAYKAVEDTLPVSLSAVYEKLKGVERNVLSALVQHTSAELSPVIAAMKVRQNPWLAGYRVRIVDGNHLASTERRIEVLRASKAGPLPGLALVVFDPQRSLVTEMIPCEDGHAQERSLFDELLALVGERDVWIADRNFCTLGLLVGVLSRKAHFAIRQHANLPITSSGTVHRRGRCSTGEVTEQKVTITGADGEARTLRRITIKLDTPTRDGDTEMSILTSLPAEFADAIAVANLYQKRWTIETAFQKIDQTLQGELSTLGYPKAALFGFAVALCAYNVYSTVQAALESHFGEDLVREEISGYYIAEEIRTVHGGMDVALDEKVWVRYRAMSAEQLATELIAIAAHVNFKRFQKKKRGPKKPVTKRTEHADTPHVSTARLLTRQGGST